MSATPARDRLSRAGAGLRLALCAALLGAPACEPAETRPLPAPEVVPGSESGWVSDFDEGEITTRFGSNWVLWDDSPMGGSSHAEMRLEEGGAAGTPGCLVVSGSVVQGLALPAFSGVLFALVEEDAPPADMSARGGISFWAKGQGKLYRVFLRMRSDLQGRAFTASSEWKKYFFYFSDFETDGGDVVSLMFTGPSRGGDPFEFRIDQVRFE